ncbi:hypothetical protein NC651_028681 [Populus alba x Populus x berolinensis]|nr:hypothetical protein NC651_028681 [Populus alba x Populus x berolinensis]
MVLHLSCVRDGYSYKQLSHHVKLWQNLCSNYRMKQRFNRE